MKIARRDGFRIMDHLEQFTQLRALETVVRKTVPNCVFDVSFSDPDEIGVRRFQYVLFGLKGVDEFGQSVSTYLRQPFSLDGCSVNTIARGTLLTSALYSSNNNIVPLLFCYCAVEDSDNVARLGENLRKIFPEQNLPVCDSGSAIVAGLVQSSFDRDRITGCAWHVGHKNAPQHFPGLPVKLKESATALAKLVSVSEYDAKLEELRGLDLDFRNQDKSISFIAQRLVEDHVTISHNLARDVPLIRLGQVTNGPCEEMHSPLLDFRDLPVCSMVLGILKYCGDKLRESHTEAASRDEGFQNDSTQIRLALTPFAVKEVEETADRFRSSKSTKVHIRRASVNEVQAEVKVDGMSFMVGVIRNDDGDELIIDCCNFSKEYLRPCYHVVAALMMANTISIFDRRLYGNQWLTSNWRHQVTQLVPNFDIDVQSLEKDPSCRPWRHPPVIGRPKEPKRKVISNKSYRKVKICVGCDKAGHNIRTCTDVDLDLVYTKLIEGVDELYVSSDDADNDSGYGSDCIDVDEDFELESNELDELQQDQEVRVRKSHGREFTDIVNGARYEKRTRN